MNKTKIPYYLITILLPLMSCSDEANNPEITTISFRSPPSTSLEELIDKYEVILLSEEEAFLLTGLLTWDKKIRTVHDL